MSIFLTYANNRTSFFHMVHSSICNENFCDFNFLISSYSTSWLIQLFLQLTELLLSCIASISLSSFCKAFPQKLLLLVLEAVPLLYDSFHFLLSVKIFHDLLQEYDLQMHLD